MKKVASLGLILAPLFLFSQQVARNLTAANGTFIGFYEYKPTDYDANPTTKYPLIIFLHGIGERGDGVYNLPLVLVNGVPKNINQGHPMRFFWNGKWETFLVLSPQLSTAYGDWPNFYVEEMIKYAKNNMRIDTNRIILTGLSLGGGGVWRFASQSSGNAQQLAAIAPVCGTCAVSNACAMSGANLPVWAFHAQNDGVVGVGCTTSAIMAINNCNSNVKPLMTIYPDGGHGIWDRAYDTNYGWQNINMYEWFLGQNKSLPVNILPLAQAGQDISITNQVATVTLDGSTSTDADGNIARYIWKSISGPSAAVINNAVSTDGKATITGLTSVGTYVFQLTVFDGRGGSSTDNINVDVTQGSGGNIAPVANAGADQTTSAGTVSLNGASSYDSDGSIASWSWAKLSGPSSYYFSSTTIANPSVSNLTAGTYQFSLTVTDNSGASSTDYVQVTISSSSLANSTPIAKAGNDQSITLPTNNISLNGANSYDPDGTITNWNWARISGPAQYTINSPQGISTTITGLAQGTYGFTLTVTDNAGAVSKDTVVVVVSAASLPSPPPPTNQAPVANAGANSIVSLPTTTATLNGSLSSDPDGSIVNYQWSKIGGPDFYTATSLTSPTVNLSNLVQGLYTFQLKVTDNAGALGFAYVTVTVNQASANQAPIAKAGNDISITLPTNNITLDGSASNDPDGTIASYSWTKLSGPVTGTIGNPSTASTSVTNLVEGTYQFRLEIKDNAGQTATDDVTVIVQPAVVTPPASGYNQAPIAVSGGDASITLPVNSFQLNAGGSYDSDGSIVSYQWSRIGGLNNYNSTVTNNALVSLTNLQEGVYIFMLTVTDNAGKSGYDYLTLTVKPAGSAPANQLPVAKAGNSSSINSPANSVVLDGSSSYDPDGTILYWNWQKISGPTSGSIQNSSIATTSAIGLVAGVYQFQLTVTDNAGASNSAQISITVNAAPVSAPPISKAGPDVNLILPTNSTDFNGYNSYDPDGVIVNWQWTKISGPVGDIIENPSGGNTRVSALVQGTYVYKFSVTDNSGQISNDTIQVFVSSTAGQTNKQAVAIETTNLSKDKLITYPNPAVNSVQLRISSIIMGKGKISILDINGRLVKSIEFTKNQETIDTRIDISTLSNGVYIAEVMVEEKTRLVSKFIKK